MDSYSAKTSMKLGGKELRIASLMALEKRGWSLGRLPFCMRILLENLLRREDGAAVTAVDIEAVANWDPQAQPSVEIAFMPARVLLQDFTGVPAIVDLAAMRDAMRTMGGDPKKINPLQPAELVIDHSVQVDEYGTDGCFPDQQRARVRAQWGALWIPQMGPEGVRQFQGRAARNGHRPPGEPRVSGPGRHGGGATGSAPPQAYPDTLVGTDSHTTMINGLGILGWGVGGIEAEAAMLGQPISMLVPQVVGFRLVGELSEGATATDLVLTVTQMLRERGVVGKFVEYFGPGLAGLPLADRATLANMAPEYGATCGIFPVDTATLDYLALTGRPQDQIDLVEAYIKEQGLFLTQDSPEAEYSDTLELDLATVEASLAGPKRPQDRILLGDVKQSFTSQLGQLSAPTGGSSAAAARAV